MDWEQFIFYGLIGFAVSFTLNYMNEGASRKIEKNKNGETELRMNKLYQILGYTCIVMTSIFLVAALYYQDRELYLIGGIILLIFGGLGVSLLMYYRNHRLIFNDQRIIVYNWRGKPKQLNWNEIEQIKFNLISGYLKVTSNATKLIIHQHLVGLKVFLKKMEEKTKWKAEELNLPINMK